MKLNLTIKQKIALKAFARQQGRQWRLSLGDMWRWRTDGPTGYYGTDTNAEVLDTIRPLVGGDARKLPLP